MVHRLFNLPILYIFSTATLAGCKINSHKMESSSQTIEVVNPDFGILPEKYKQRSNMRPLMWRCFSLKDVKVDYRTWKDNDPMGPSDKIVDLCDFRIEVRTTSDSHLYVGRRAKLIQYCDDFKSAWKKLTLNEKQICFDGETLTRGEPEFDEKTQKMMTVWTWDKIATRKGCYSFWTGYSCTDF